MAEARRRRRWLPGELQWHLDYGRVRRLRVTRRRFRLALAVLGVAALSLVALVAATMVRMNQPGEADALGENQRLAARFEALAARYGDVRQLASEIDGRLCRIVLAYGVGADAAEGCGEPVDVLDEPALTVRQGEVVLIESGVEEDVDRLIRRIERRLAAAREWEEAEPDLAVLTPSAAPLRGDDFVLVGAFGDGWDGVTGEPVFRRGIELAAGAGEPVHATAPGRVTFTGRGAALGRGFNTWGGMAAIRHGERFITLYARLDSTAVRGGENVARGQVIGAVGSSGGRPEPGLLYSVVRRRPDGGWEAVDPRLHILDYRWREEGFIASDRPPPASMRMPRALLR